MQVRSMAVPPRALVSPAADRLPVVYEVYALIESAKLNGLNPQHYLADVLARIADHRARRIAELLPWNWQPVDTTRAAA